MNRLELHTKGLLSNLLSIQHNTITTNVPRAEEQGICADNLWDHLIIFSPPPQETFLGLCIVWLSNGREREREIQKMFSFFRANLYLFLKWFKCPQTTSIHPASLLAYALHIARQPTEQEKQHSNMALKMN